MLYKNIRRQTRQHIPERTSAHTGQRPEEYAVSNTFSISRLFSGCDAGGIYGDSYDVSICEGSCQGFAVFSGKAAAEHIAANA